MDSSQSNTSLPSSDAAPHAPAAVRPIVRDKLRLRFRKQGALRLLSHHDLMRCFERMLRRADLPCHHTQGFHPHPRLVFALSLPLGVVGLEEIAELELDAVLPPEEVHERLARQAPAGLDILSVERIDLKSGARVRGLCYRIAVPAERVPPLRDKMAELLAAAEVWLTRDKTHKTPSPGPHPEAEREGGVGKPRVDLRPFVRDLRLVSSLEETTLEIDLWLTPAGTAKPVEVLGLLGLTDLHDAGAVLERSRLELYDD